MNANTFEELIDIVGIDKVLGLINEKIKSLESLKKKIINSQNGNLVETKVLKKLSITGYPKEIYDALKEIDRPTYPMDILNYLNQKGSSIKDYNVRQALSAYKNRYFTQHGEKGPWTIKK